MEKNPGIICEVIEGSRKGQYAFAPNAKQDKHFQKLDKMYVEYYEDVTMQKPVMALGLHLCGLTAASNLKAVGFVD